MSEEVKMLTAETEEGRRALEEVMAHSYQADVSKVPPEWARVRVVGDVPVAFILVDPARTMDAPVGEFSYAFITDVAVREDRREEGHFKAIMEDTFAALRVAHIPLLVTHGKASLYRPLKFDVFTHHSGVFATPELIDHALARGGPEAKDRLTIEERDGVLPDLLLVTDVRADSLVEAAEALRAAATVARERGKSRILFEYPPAPSYGSTYPVHTSLDYPFLTLARAIGAEHRLQGSYPEGGPVGDGDWIRVINVREALCDGVTALPQGVTLPEGEICFETDGGRGVLASHEGKLTSPSFPSSDAAWVIWPAVAIGQLITGYRSAAELCALHRTKLPEPIMSLLDLLFPSVWRFSRNENWTYRA